MYVLYVLLIASTFLFGTDQSAMKDRRSRAAAEFRDGVLILHANSELEITADGFHQDPLFYYFTGLGNTVGALLAIDGKSGESWLFLPTKPPYWKSGLQPEMRPGSEAAAQSGIEHVADWSELESFLRSRAEQTSLRLYYAANPPNFPEMPSNFLSHSAADAPLWMQVILQRLPTIQPIDATLRADALLAVQDSEEIAALRSAAKATVAAMMAGLHAIRTGVSQRDVEAIVEDTCWRTGAHGTAFWPWAMAGENANFPNPFHSVARYDHLNQTMHSGELVRLDVGCEWNHYQGDLGRTVPVCGHYTDEQRETWNLFVAAYRAGAAALRNGVTVDEVFAAWRNELLRHRASAKSPLAQHAIDYWSDKKNVPYWQVHTTNLLAGYPVGPLRAGTTINFEPMGTVDGQAFFLEDMYLITANGAEVLTPGVPYSADEIEAAMR